MLDTVQMPRARHNWPQITTEEFYLIFKEVGFWAPYCTSSPGSSKVNGRAESAINTAKWLIFEKGSQRKSYMAILDYRNTPTEAMDSSPAQQLGAWECYNIKIIICYLTLVINSPMNNNYIIWWSTKIGRAHVWTPVTPISRMPSSAWKKKKNNKTPNQ